MPLKEPNWQTEGREAAPPGFTPAEQQIPVSKLQEMVDLIVNDPTTPNSLKNRALANYWLARVESFREAEESLMITGQYEHGLSQHRVFITDLIATGEAIVASVTKDGMGSAPFTVEDLRATLNSLHSTFELQHRLKNPQKTDELLTQLLNGNKP
jgi:hypothetical protein